MGDDAAPSSHAKAGNGSQNSGHVSTVADAALTVREQSLAGGVAMMLTKASLYPASTIKSRLQARRPSVPGSVRPWALTGLYRGFMLKVVVNFPYQMIYMAAYVRTRDRLVVDSGRQGALLAYVVSGIVAEITSSVVRLPMEVLKVRLQTGIYHNTIEGLRDFIGRPLHFYGMFAPQTLLHDCPFSAFSWFVYESARQQIIASREVPKLESQESLALGVVAGGATSFITNPLDVVKTRILTRQHNESDFLHIRSTVKSIALKEGWACFWRGAGLRIAHHAPSHGLFMLIFDSIKNLMHLHHMSMAD